MRSKGKADEHLLSGGYMPLTRLRDNSPFAIAVMRFCGAATIVSGPRRNRVAIGVKASSNGTKPLLAPEFDFFHDEITEGFHPARRA